MPYINLSTNIKVEDKKSIHDKLGELITIMPNKSLARTMICVEDEKFLTFGGSNEPCAYIETKVNAGTNHSCNKTYADAVIDAVAEMLKIPASRVYVNVEEKLDWFSRG